jgi:hypothetical protein
MSLKQEGNLLRSAPYFPVSNVERSMAFYQVKLGFGLDYAGGSPTEFAICSRDGFAIMLRQVAEPELVVPNREARWNMGRFFLG